MNIKETALTFTAALLGGLAITAIAPTPSQAYQTWSHNTIGGTTFHNGYGSNGSYSGTTTRIGGTTFHNGYDSNGNSYSGSCSTIGSSTFCNSY